MGLAKVLVVDDEPEVREVLRDLLSDLGYDVILADSGPTALDALSANKPDLVLLDVFMPGMDGVETLRRMTALDPSVPVIVVTANTDVDITSKLLALGAADYIPKPFDVEYLHQAISVQLAAARDR
jgi:CheY-like chemotaxis protein